MVNRAIFVFIVCERATNASNKNLYHGGTFECTHAIQLHY